MKISVLGTGMVGQSIASKLVALGHDVMMGSRSRDNDKGQAWVKSTKARASLGTFADSAAFGELVFNCTQGGATLAALEAAGKQNLSGKVLVDIANPLDFRNRPAANDDLCAMLRQPPRDTGAEAGSATCDDCHLAGEIEEIRQRLLVRHFHTAATRPKSPAPPNRTCTGRAL